jgi:outer membrane protein assembly factor BamD (BamD/ComL family)
MDQKETALGTVIVLIGILFILLRNYYVAVVLIIVGGYFLYRGIRSPSDGQIAKRANSLIYNEIYKKGIDKIRSGTMNVTEEQFSSVMEKIAWIFGRQSLMPQIGFDAVYLHYQKESDAAENLERLQREGIKASIVQDKSDWQIMIEFK